MISIAVQQYLVCSGVLGWRDGRIHLLFRGKEIPFEELQSVAGREEVLAS